MQPDEALSKEGGYEKEHSLIKNWRCINCFVCQGCNRAEPEGLLMVCDECDSSYHTVCVKNPLEKVPEGRFLCDNCVKCKNCGSTSAGGNNWSGKEIRFI
ncbi:hypothetical protein ROZALSC1DRAFT_17840 [Rozella allomycis CSF55]|uniref:PHD-type domain-containing protein n=1 Tax=Rozella allomycis (strain CSF55) TaxID=988480 RepID=A0A4P9YBK3_ROZAC|nr:hypothetical protein ROZALSC1DRAFT_17840 [Rozella allomycis CSF55]